MLSAYLHGLGIMLALATLTWLLSLYKRDVSIVDSLWALLLLAGALAYVADFSAPRNLLILTLVGLWALRLSGYLTWRNWGEPEDRRYAAMRAKYAPHFAYSSLVIVFVLQAVLAWVVSLPLWWSLAQPQPWHWLDVLAALLVLSGLLFESVADWQLTRFKAKPANRGQVLRHGLWRYSRHPNYFGECIVWWGFFLFALPTGAWTVLAPLLMTLLLLKVSGVSLLEHDIGERRPAYRDYIASTNAFVPGPPRRGSATDQREVRP